MPFTIAQTVRGLLTTFQRGDYSLTVTRIREIKPKTTRDDVIELLVHLLTPEEKAVLKRYAKDLFS